MTWSVLILYWSVGVSLLVSLCELIGQFVRAYWSVDASLLVSWCELIGIYLGFMEVNVLL